MGGWTANEIPVCEVIGQLEKQQLEGYSGLCGGWACASEGGGTEGRLRPHGLAETTACPWPAQNTLEKC